MLVSRREEAIPESKGLNSNQGGVKMKRSVLSPNIKVIGICVLFFIAFLGLAESQEKFPSREIIVVTGVPPGGSTDLTTRAFCNAASKILDQPIVVLNKPGAAHALALSYAMLKKPDGYTLITLSSAALYQQVRLKVPYDYTKDFRFIMQNYDFQQGIVVKADSPWKTLDELIAYSKANPGKVRVGIMGLAAAQHVLMERLALKTGAKWTYIPYDSHEAVTACLGGHVEATCGATSWIPNVDAGQLMLLAVAGGGDRRIPKYKDVPTVLELYGIPCLSFQCMGGLKGLPDHTVDILHRAFKKALEDPDYIQMCEKFSTPIVYRGPEEITRYIMETHAIISKVLNEMGLKRKE